MTSSVVDRWTPSSGVPAHVAELRRPGHTSATFAAVLDVLEILPYRDHGFAAEPVHAAREVAGALGVQSLQRRARLVAADLDRRDGRVAEAGRVARETIDWALSHGEAHVLSRSHRLLAVVLRSVGDTAGALEHAVRCVEQLPAAAAPRTLADHLLVLAMTLDEAGLAEDSRRRHDQVLDLAVEIGDPMLALDVLNNMAFSRHDAGDGAGAWSRVQQMQDLAAQHEVELTGVQLDTVARVQLLLGRPLDAELTLQPALVETSPAAERVVVPELLLTAVRAQRELGALDRAQRTLDRAVVMLDQQGLVGFRVQALLEQSLVHAAAGDYRRAYEEHVRFAAEAELLRSNDREARTGILQAVFETTEARRDSERFREMSLRDPLTGLYNRRFMDAHLDSLLQHRASTGESLSVALIDLDHFKAVNDTFSHQVGDAVLATVATLLTATAGKHAAVGRLGGEEFVVALPGRDAEAGLRAAEAMRRAAAAYDWSRLAGGLRLTMSIGLSTAPRGVTRSMLLAQADRNLYAAKRAGRDRVVGGDD